MVRKPQVKRNKTKFWTLWSILFAVVLIVGIVGNSITSVYATIINKTLNVSTTEITGLDETDSSSNYEFTKEAEEQLRADNIALVNKVVQEGATLVKNKNDALPITSGNSVSIFGIGQYMAIDMVNGLEANGVNVNRDLYDRYMSLSESYQNIRGTSVNEVPFSEVEDVAGSGDVAIVVLSRSAGEGADCVSQEGADYLALSNGETELLQKLTSLKQEGTFKKIIVVESTSNSIDSYFMQDGNTLNIDVDAVVWLGMATATGFGAGGYTAESAQAFADLICSKDGIDFSGRIVDTMYVDNQLLPELQNIATDADASAVDKDLIQEVLKDQSKWAGAQGNYWRSTTTYAEGIYHSYRYYETRYEDYILNGNANGAYTGWSYDGYVAAPFGTGLHYNTGISYENMSVEENVETGTFDVTVTVRNDGSSDVKHSVLVYMQTPYSQRDAENGNEESSIKLVGYEKVDVPAGSSTNVTVSVDQEEMATYDANEAKTYIRDAGTYYLTVGESVHDAMNNILSAKSTGNEEAIARMTELGESGNASLTWSADYTYDDQIFSTSETGYEITNQFDYGDLNKDEDAQAAGNNVTYLSRKNWIATFPQEVIVKYNEAMVEQARPQIYEEDEDAIAETEMPEFNQNYGEDTVYFNDLKGLDYDDPLWDKFLSQLSLDEIVTNVSLSSTTEIADYLVPAAVEQDGPTSIGSTTENGVEPLGAVAEDLRAATFNKQILEDVGRQLFGENMVHSAGNTVAIWWGPGMNIHRTPYGGRNYSYYSEDPFTSGISAAYETMGCQSVGGVVVAKHLAINDQEVNRHGISVWVNEQSAREIYLKDFEMAVEIGGLDCFMTSFNRIGMEWTGQSENLITNVARNEWGTQGEIITDMYETDYEDAVDGIIGGGTRWLCNGTNNNVLDPIQERIDANDTVFINKLVDAAHHNLWSTSHSSALDGFNSNTVINTIIPWWKKSIYALIIVSAVLTLGSILLAVRSFTRKRKIVTIETE